MTQVFARHFFHKLLTLSHMKHDIETIRKEFRRSEEARYIHRLHGVLLVLLGLSTVKAGKLLGDPQRTVAHWVGQWKAHGLDGLKDAEKAGRPSALDAKQKQALAAALNKSPKEFGFEGETWTGQIVSSLLKKRYDITLSPRQCFRLVKAIREGVES
jgi:transposase